MWFKKLMILIFIISLYNTATCQIIKVLVMPNDLVKLSEENGFTQISDFYSNVTTESSTQPPFVWGIDSTVDPFCSVAFVCQTKSDSINAKIRYYLIVAQRNSFLEELTITDSIRIIRPGGLSLFKDTSLTLDKFYSYDNPTLFGPEVKVRDYCIKYQRADGFIDFYYKYKGKWFICSETDI